jgi:hypothetical protein
MEVQKVLSGSRRRTIRWRPPARRPRSGRCSNGGCSAAAGCKRHVCKLYAALECALVHPTLSGSPRPAQALRQQPGHVLGQHRDHGLPRTRPFRRNGSTRARRSSSDSYSAAPCAVLAPGGPPFIGSSISTRGAFPTPTALHLHKPTQRWQRHRRLQFAGTDARPACRRPGTPTTSSPRCPGPSRPVVRAVDPELIARPWRCGSPGRRGCAV